MQQDEATGAEWNQWMEVDDEALEGIHSEPGRSQIGRVWRRCLPSVPALPAPAHSWTLHRAPRPGYHPLKIPQIQGPVPYRH